MDSIIQDLQAEIKSLRAENAELQKRLARYEIDRFPRTYIGAKNYVENLLKWFVFANPVHVADELNRLGFPAFRDANWTEDKAKRLIRKLRKTTEIVTIDAEASVVAYAPDQMKRIALVKEVA